MARRKGLDGLCPSFALQTPIMFGFAEMGFESLIFFYIQDKIKNSTTGVVLLLMARRKGLDGLCPSFASQTPIMFGFAEMGFESHRNFDRKK
jgi:hypothetical protein